MAATFRFRPRFRGLAMGAGVLGAGLSVLSAIAGDWVWMAFSGVGAIGGGLYLLSPAWRMTVVVDDEAIEVRSGTVRRFRLGWAEVVKVTYSEKTSTAFVDGGSPAMSLLIPGDGAPAPYDLEDKAALCQEILTRVGEEKVERVARLRM